MIHPIGRFGVADGFNLRSTTNCCREAVFA